MAENSVMEDGVQYAAPGEKLTKWAKEPALSELKADYDAAKPAHDAQIAEFTRWENLRDIKGSTRPKKVAGRSGVQPKMIRRQAEWRYSALSEALLSAPNMVTLKPVTFEDAKGAHANQLLLNSQFRTKINRVKFVDDFVHSTVDEGTSVLRAGWLRQTKKVKKMVPVYTHVEMSAQEELDAFKAAYQIKLTNPRQYEQDVPEEMRAAIDYYEEAQQFTVATKTGEEEREVEEIVFNHPTVKVCDPRNVVIDPSCEGDISKALFVVESFETHKAELEKGSVKYKNLDKVLWATTGKGGEPNHTTNTPAEFQFKDQARRKVTAYEYWGFYDIKGDGCLVPIVATWIGNVLIRMEENPYPDQKIPYVLVPYMPRKRELYGEPDAELLEDNQNIQGALTRGMIDLLGRSANAQHGYAKGLLDPLNKRRYESGQDYEFNPAGNPAQMIIEHTYPEIPASAMNMLQMQNMEAEALTGVKSFAGGMSGNAYGDVASGIRGMLDASAKREMGILRRLAKGIIEIARKWTSMNAVFLSEEETIRVTNMAQEGEGAFLKVRREDLIGDYDYDTDISTPESDNAKAGDLGMMLQTIGPNIDPTITTVILADIADLKRMPELAEKLRNWKPTPNPAQEELLQLQLEEQKMKNAKLKSEAELNAAKAEETKAKGDLKTLDFVEQETGTKHARDMERQTAQSHGNQSLAVTKALLTSKKLDELPGDIDAAIGFNHLTAADNTQA